VGSRSSRNSTLPPAHGRQGGAADAGHEGLGSGNRLRRAWSRCRKRRRLRRPRRCSDLRRPICWNAWLSPWRTPLLIEFSASPQEVLTDLARLSVAILVIGVDDTDIGVGTLVDVDLAGCGSEGDLQLDVERDLICAAACCTREAIHQNILKGNIGQIVVGFVGGDVAGGVAGQLEETQCLSGAGGVEYR